MVVRELRDIVQDGANQWWGWGRVPADLRKVAKSLLLLGFMT